MFITTNSEQQTAEVELDRTLCGPSTLSEAEAQLGTVLAAVLQRLSGRPAAA